MHLLDALVVVRVELLVVFLFVLNLSVGDALSNRHRLIDDQKTAVDRQQIHGRKVAQQQHHVLGRYRRLRAARRKEVRTFAEVPAQSDGGKPNDGAVFVVGFVGRFGVQGVEQGRSGVGFDLEVPAQFIERLFQLDFQAAALLSDCADLLDAAPKIQNGGDVLDVRPKALLFGGGVEFLQVKARVFRRGDRFEQKPLEGDFVGAPSFDGLRIAPALKERRHVHVVGQKTDFPQADDERSHRFAREPESVGEMIDAAFGLLASGLVGAVGAHEAAADALGVSALLVRAEGRACLDALFGLGEIFKRQPVGIDARRIHFTFDVARTLERRNRRFDLDFELAFVLNFLVVPACGPSQLHGSLK